MSIFRFASRATSATSLPARSSLAALSLAALSAVSLAGLSLEGCAPGIGAAAAADVGAGVAGEGASFSAVINGTLITADRVTAQGFNKAGITPDGSEVRELIFTLAPASGDEAATPELSLRFNLPVKQGTHQMMSNQIAACDDCGVTLDQNSSPFAEYSPQSMQVSITSLTANRVTGTFSGTLEFSSHTSDSVRRGSPPIVRVENGQFDIPIAQP